MRSISSGIYPDRHVFRDTREKERILNHLSFPGTAGCGRIGYSGRDITGLPFVFFFTVFM